MDTIYLDATETIHYCWGTVPVEMYVGGIGHQPVIQYLIRGRLMDKISRGEDGTVYAWDTNVGEVVRIVVND